MRYSGAYVPDEDPVDRWAYERAARPRKKKRTSGILLRVLVALLLVCAVALLYVRQYTVAGDSMEPTLMAGDRVFYVGFSHAEYGDLIIFDAGETYGLVIKRVAGLPGDRIEIAPDGSLIRNGEPVEEAYILPDALGNSEMQEITVARGRLFVLGDHRAASIDSRDIRVGQIRVEAVRGIVTRLLRDTQPKS